jgi:type VI secretion system protein ImpB
MEEFKPGQATEQLAPLKDLLDLRRRLQELLSRLEGNDKLKQLLAELLRHTEKAMACPGCTESMPKEHDTAS